MIFYDGVCLLCNRFIRFALGNDRKKQLYVSPLQSSFAQKILKDFPVETERMDTVILYREGQVYTESDVTFEVLQLLGFPWSLFGAFRIVPKTFRDAVYRRVARNRYRWFGRSVEVCEMPDQSMQERVIS